MAIPSPVADARSTHLGMQHRSHNTRTKKKAAAFGLVDGGCLVIGKSQGRAIMRCACMTERYMWAYKGALFIYLLHA